jgi:hypothetical protein
MNALVGVGVGARVYYDCPHMSGEDYRSDEFFRKNRGKTGVLKNFCERIVGVLDSRGRLPGVYVDPKCINVQFDGEEKVHTGLNIAHFVLIGGGETVGPDTDLNDQKIRDLPHPLMFWPGDLVRKTNDLLHTVRAVEEVLIEDPVRYALAETVEERKKRESDLEADVAQRQEAAGKSGDPMAFFGIGLARMTDFPRIERCAGEELALLERGNVHHLYNDPERLAFASPADELLFWAQDGVSHTVYDEREALPRYEWSLNEAKQLVQDGAGDLVIASKEFKNVIITGRRGEFKVRKLHRCFSQHRERVRMLSLSLTEPPTEADIPFAKMAQSLLEIG